MKKLVATDRDNHQDQPRINQARYASSAKTQEGYNTQVSQKIEGRVTKKLSQEFSRTESCIWAPYHNQTNFFWTHKPVFTPNPVPETSGFSNKQNQRTNEDRSQNDPHPEVGVSFSQSWQELSPEETLYNTFPQEQRIFLCFIALHTPISQ